jgi:hypothetical protein
MKTLLTVCALMTFSAAGAMSSVPSPATSTVPACLTVCPAGDVVYTVTVRDAAGFPVGGSSVVVDLSHCSGVNVCLATGSDPYTYNPVARTISVVANAAGVASFPIRAGGVCSGGGAVFVFADGVLLRQLAGVSSPDQDGNLTVDGADILIVNGKLGSGDVTADFDCDGTVTNADLNFAIAHGGHTCQPPTSTHRRSWGELKQIYR